MTKLINLFTTLPVLMGLGASLLFAVGYLSHAFFGKNNPVEQIAEEVLKEEYKIDVEFTPNDTMNPNV